MPAQRGDSRTPKWPKNLPPLTEEQQRIAADFMDYWLEVLPKRFSLIERYNHGYPVRASAQGPLTTLEIGAGRGEHLLYEDLSPAQQKNYYALDSRDSIRREVRERFPHVNVVTADCQRRLPFPDDFFDRVLAIHVLEHLPDLPAAVHEAHRVCKKNGTFIVVIPCEGGLLYGLARRISAQRIFERRYQQSYRWFIEHEHINKPVEIIEELRACFRIVEQSFYPVPLPFEWCNLSIGLKLVPQST